MIVYDLICDRKHRFEGWFKNAEDYQQQLATGLLNCPLCASIRVHKIPSASYICSSLPAPNSNETQTTSSTSKDVRALAQLQEYIAKNFTHVGPRFTEEAKKIHYGESEKRNICGEATQAQVKELHEEGIDILPLPINWVDKNKLS